MAGGGQLGGDRGHQKRGSFATKRKSKKRVGFVLDMTPLVDIAFPAPDVFHVVDYHEYAPGDGDVDSPQVDDVVVKESELLTLSIDDRGRMFYSSGQEAPQELALKDLQSLAINQNMALKNRLITSLKISSEAPYGAVINVLDELNLAEGDITSQLASQGIKRERKFSIMTLTPEEAAILKTL